MAQSVLVKTYLPRGLVSMLIVESKIRGTSISRLVRQAVESAAPGYSLVPTSELAELLNQLEIPYINDDEQHGELRVVGDMHTISCPFPRSNCVCLVGKQDGHASNQK